ncbi:unnamed protein product, partial [marine sediment metagenome]
MTVKSYAEAINEAHQQLLTVDDRVFVIGQGADSYRNINFSPKH